MVLVIVIAVAWMVILGPGLVKRRTHSVDGISSISHFHHQLRVLEHSSPPPIVPPAYRLRGLDSSGELRSGHSSEVAPLPVLTVVGANQLPRPALAFLGAEPDEPTTPGRATDGQAPGSGPSGGYRPQVPVTRVTGIAAPVGDSHARRLARRRRRDTLGILAMAFIGTGMIGFVPGASMAWVVTAVSGVALAAYLALLVHLRQMADQRERKLHYLRPGSGRGLGSGRAAMMPLYVSGRYAHPSNQAAAAH